MGWGGDIDRKCLVWPYPPWSWEPAQEEILALAQTGRTWIYGQLGIHFRNRHLVFIVKQWCTIMDNVVHNIVHNCTILFRVVQYGTRLYKTVQCCTLLFWVVQYSRMLYNIVLYCLELYNMILIHCCTMMYNAEKKCTKLHNTVQCCITLYNMYNIVRCCTNHIYIYGCIQNIEN